MQYKIKPITFYDFSKLNDTEDYACRDYNIYMKFIKQFLNLKIKDVIIPQDLKYIKIIFEDNSIKPFIFIYKEELINITILKLKLLRKLI
jgi:hypothetical protein